MRWPPRRQSPRKAGSEVKRVRSGGQHLKPITKQAGDRKRRAIAATTQFYASARDASLPKRWRERLPTGAAYFGQHVAQLGEPDAQGWAIGCCPFHDDRERVLRVHIVGERAVWGCPSCNLRGDLVDFHERLRGLSFVPAVRDLLGLTP